MADDGSILVAGAAGQLGAVGRTVTGLLLERGLPVRAISIQNATPSPQHWLSEQALLGTHAAPIASGASILFPGPVFDRLQLVRCIHTRRGTGLRPRMRNRLEYHHGEVFVHLSRIHGKRRQAVSRGNAGPAGPMVRLDAEVQRVDPARRRWFETERPTPEGWIESLLKTAAR
jgi:hypothetical protein